MNLDLLTFTIDTKPCLNLNASNKVRQKQEQTKGFAENASLFI